MFHCWLTASPMAFPNYILTAAMDFCLWQGFFLSREWFGSGFKHCLYVHTMKQKSEWINIFNWLNHQRCTIYLVDWESDLEIQDTSWYLLDIDISHYEGPYNPLNFPLIFSVGCFPTNHDPISRFVFLSYSKLPSGFTIPRGLSRWSSALGRRAYPRKVIFVWSNQPDNWSNQPEGFIGLLSSHWGSYTRWKSFLDILCHITCIFILWYIYIYT